MIFFTTDARGEKKPAQHGPLLILHRSIAILDAKSMLSGLNNSIHSQIGQKYLAMIVKKIRKDTPIVKLITNPHDKNSDHRGLLRFMVWLAAMPTWLAS